MSDFDKPNALNSMPMATQIVGSRDETKLLLTVTEAASRLSLGRSKTYELVRAGVIPSVRITGSRRIKVSDLLRYVAALGDAA
ncbi:MAG: helix-turn-helix domain-containing protein [Dermatophilaceae bacterium]